MIQAFPPRISAVPAGKVTSKRLPCPLHQQKLSALLQLFIHAAYIYREPSVCQALCSGLGAREELRHGPFCSRRSRGLATERLFS